MLERDNKGVGSLYAPNGIPKFTAGSEIIMMIKILLDSKWYVLDYKYVEALRDSMVECLTGNPGVLG